MYFYFLESSKVIYFWQHWHLLLRECLSVRLSVTPRESRLWARHTVQWRYWGGEWTVPCDIIRGGKWHCNENVKKIAEEFIRTLEKRSPEKVERTAVVTMLKRSSIMRTMTKKGHHFFEEKNTATRRVTAPADIVCRYFEVIFVDRHVARQAMPYFWLSWCRVSLSADIFGRQNDDRYCRPSLSTGKCVSLTHWLGVNP